MTQRLTRAQRHTVGQLVQYLGVVAGVRRSVEEIAARLPAHQRRSAEADRIVAKKMAALEGLGYAAPADHPQGGWALTEDGAALIRRDIAEVQAALERAKAAG